MAKVGVVQAGSVLGDTAGTLAKLERLCTAAANEGLKLAVFPEAFIGGYPKGLTFGAAVGMRTDAGRELFRQYAECAIAVPGPVTAELGKLARKARLYLVVGVIEPRWRDALLHGALPGDERRSPGQASQAHSDGLGAPDLGMRRWQHAEYV
jgi:predicted amidohydrolase